MPESTTPRNQKRVYESRTYFVELLKYSFWIFGSGVWISDHCDGRGLTAGTWLTVCYRSCSLGLGADVRGAPKELLYLDFFIPSPDC